MRTVSALCCFAVLLFSGAAHAVRITPAHSGTWFDPDYDRQGFSIEVLERAGQGPERVVAVQWYTYDDDGSPTWAIGVGVTEGNVVGMTMRRAVGGARPPAQVDPSELVDWAEVVFTFGTCANAVADFEMIDSGDTGSYALRRLTQIGATTCTGGLGDEVPPDFQPVTLVRNLGATAGHPDAQGQVKLFLRPAYATLEIDLRRVPAGDYAVRVGGSDEGTLSVVRVGGSPSGQGGTTMGQARFSSPLADGDQELDFDPRGQRIELVDANGVVAAAVDFPAQADGG